MSDEGPATSHIKTIRVHHLAFSCLMVWMLGEGHLDKPPAQLSLLAKHESSILMLQVWVPRACLPIPISILNPKIHLTLHSTSQPAIWTQRTGPQGRFSLANFMHTQNTDFYILDDEKVETGTVHLDVISCWGKNLRLTGLA